MKKAVHEGLLFSCCQKAAPKHGWYPIYNLISKDFLFCLTVISTVAERSGEISFHHGTSLITVRDFRVQSLNRTKSMIIHNYMQHHSK